VRPFGAPVCPDTAIAADTVYMPGTVDVPAMALASSVQPAYPPDLRNAGIQGEVIMQFVVNTAGCAEPASIRALAATNPGFVPNVQAALRRLRYEPARHRGKRVAQMVQQAFTFTLNY
jgi:protein TonB